ncbi:peptidyl-prolyl cis-trans isomerase FKBP11-like isoform X1 [Scyliorhinus canicula]|uniref:peptidyl-prolyl cis-trans isomerase FKBP11-like isoform X1 n=1 Tax=Scyliorhinus canicula TaxID=7830 RepID=UPI0018F4A1B0|nr:peptidyl-prolyl cis-trans isomerase FKBP11-like isoform X1 [Scyliorhinus canicula]
MSRAVLLFLIIVSLNGFSSQDEKGQELKVEVLLKPEGCPELSAVGDRLHIHYTGKLEDGTLFDNSLIREPLVVELGRKQVIPGLEQGLLDMCVGEKRKLTVPPNLGYGRRGFPPSIPGDSVLLFETELVTLVKSTYWKKLMDNMIPIACFLLVPGLLCLIGYYLYLKANVPKISKRKFKEEKKSKAKNK